VAEVAAICRLIGMIDVAGVPVAVIRRVSSAASR
jgi:hypothetical protein